MYTALRPYLFRLEPEQAHAFTLALLRLVGTLPPLQSLVHKLYPVEPRPIRVFGLEFINPVGLAAGYDKDGLGWRGLACLGFGHIEVGTVTPRPQPGNPKPRLFRLPEDKALINRMGFPGKGADFVARRLAGKRPPGLVVGVNLGKNKDTPLESAADDYLFGMQVFAPLADYLAINVSSPNTVGLRRLQERDALQHLLQVLAQEREPLSKRLAKPIPLLVKIAPDLTDDDLDDLLLVALDMGIDGLIVANTTIQRERLRSSLALEIGGLSGAPLTQRCLELTRQIVARSQDKLPVVSAGGIMSPADAKARLDAGAVLVQIYTGLVYSGPGLVRQIVHAIA